MAELPRLNGVIRALEAGQHALTCFAPAELNTAIAMSAAKFDGCVFEMEHQPWDGRLLRDCLQYMLNRAQIAKAASVVPGVTPMARVPVNGAEMAQWQAKQALDMGCYGIVFPHISTVEEAANAVGACRYPRLKSAPRYEPAGIRGDGPTAAARYWGLSQQEYYQKADVWPLDPQGEIFCILQIEDTRGVENLDDILKNVPGIGCILIGEGDLSQELGYPRQYEHKVVLEWMKRIVDICKKHNVVVGHPHVEQGNAERVVKEGYRLLMCAPVQSFGHLEAARKHTGTNLIRSRLGPSTGAIAIVRISRQEQTTYFQQRHEKELKRVPPHTALVPRMLPAGISNCSLPLQTITSVLRKTMLLPSKLTALHGNGASGESEYLNPCA